MMPEAITSLNGCCRNGLLPPLIRHRFPSMIFHRFFRLPSDVLSGEVADTKMLLVRCYGLSLSDQYWICPEGAELRWEDINFFQRKMAYGYKQTEKSEDQVVFTLTAYPKRLMTLKGNASDGYACYTTIGGKPAQLKSLYVKTKPGNPMSVEYVELRGISEEGGELVTEQVRP